MWSETTCKMSMAAKLALSTYRYVDGLVGKLGEFIVIRYDAPTNDYTLLSYPIINMEKCEILQIAKKKNQQKKTNSKYSKETLKYKCIYLFTLMTPYKYKKFTFIDNYLIFVHINISGQLYESWYLAHMRRPLA